MIQYIIEWSLRNRFMVVLLTLIVTGWGLYSVKNTPLDAIPDLSDVQVIIKTSFPGQAPQVVEDQVTYPLTTAMLSVPKAVNVRGYSFFGDSYIYVIFEDGTDPYWARSRVLEYLSQAASKLPAEAKPELGPDATGVGWVFEYALVDRSNRHDLAQLRSLQDWYLKFELQTVPGVSEVATIGGMVKQYQVVVDPDSLRAYGLNLSQIRKAIQRGNKESGGSVIEMGEAEYMIRATGYIDSIEDLKEIPLGMSDKGVPITLKDVAQVRLGPQMRRGVAELDGEGEVVGGVIIMRFGENALSVIANTKKKLEELARGLPDGVEIVPTYDRSGLIHRAVETLNGKLLEEFLVVAVVCAVFLFHLRSALVVILSLPVGILVAFIVMERMGINANIMSLGGIAIAIGAMVDAAIVMIENVHKHIEKTPLTRENRWAVMAQAATEVGPPLFFSLLIITLSFLPVFTLEAQEGRLFAPLAYTKTFAMAAAAGLSITLVPVLMGYFIRGHITPEHKNPVNRLLIALYRPVIHLVLRIPRLLVVLTLVLIAVGLWPLDRIGSEFMPDLDEGDLLYMPSAFPAVSIGKAQQLLQQTDKLIKTVPEVKRVFGKIGRADSATDPAPLTMVETTIQLKPREEWRPGMTMDKLKRELDGLVKFPGLTNAWVMPIKNRIDMLATGIKTPVGVKIAGPDLKVIQDLGRELEKVIQEVPGTVSVYSERVAGGRYVTVDIDRKAAARFGLNITDVQEVVRTALGGMRVTQSVEGLERYPVNVRYPRETRDSLEKIRNLPVVTPAGAHIPLAEVAEIRIESGPGMIKTENARLNGWTYIDIQGRDLGSYVVDAQKAVADQLELPPGYSVSWSGQYEYMMRAKEKLSTVVPVTLVIIVLLLYLNFRNLTEVLIIIGTLPLALAGGIWLLYLLDYNLSVAVGVGFIALAGVSVEIGVVMLVYLNQALRRIIDQAAHQGRTLVRDDVRKAVVEGALLRVRPIMMTVAAIIAGLLPIMLGGGTGSEVMRRIAAPMIGGMVSATILTLIVLPAVFLIWKQRGIPADDSLSAQEESP
ncbi:efflux RND transporter permease subunit [Thiolapillus sp.]